MFQKYFLTFVVLAALTGCVENPALGAPAATSTEEPVIAPTATTMPKALEPTKPAAPAPTATVKPPAPTATLPVAQAAGNCSLKDSGKRIFRQPLRADGILWNWTISQLPKGDEGCAVVFEGRLVPGEEKHHVIILSLGTAKSSEFNLQDFKFAEGTFWAYPPAWNIQYTGTTKPSIGEEFVFAKRLNMVENARTPYNWEIVFHRVSLANVTYPKGATVGLVKTISCEFLTEPAQFGMEYPPDNAGLPYNTTFGMYGCWTAVKQSMTWQFWFGAGDNYKILDPKSTQGFIFPKDWKEDQVKAWAAAH